MKAEKIIQSTENIDIKIKSITLLSIEEYEQCKDFVQNINAGWWLRSPGNDVSFATLVNSCGIVRYYGYCVSYEYGIRPALIINPEPLNLKVKDKIKLMGYDWTMINNNMMLCDSIVGYTCFRKDWQAKNANDYKASDIKEWLESWCKEGAKE